jgi:hypothetical protein
MPVTVTMVTCRHGGGVDAPAFAALRYADILSSGAREAEQVSRKKTGWYAIISLLSNNQSSWRASM